MTTAIRILFALAAFLWQIVLHSNAFVSSSSWMTQTSHSVSAKAASSDTGDHLANEDLYLHIFDKCASGDVDNMYAAFSSFPPSLSIQHDRMVISYTRITEVMVTSRGF